MNEDVGLTRGDSRFSGESGNSSNALRKVPYEATN